MNPIALSVTLAVVVTCSSAIPARGQNLYWADGTTGHIKWAPVGVGGGASPSNLTTQPQPEPHSIVVGPSYIYWSDLADHMIRRMPRGGGVIQDVVDTGAYGYAAVGLALDIPAGMIYWTEHLLPIGGTSRISRASMSPGQTPALLVSGLTDAIGIQVDSAGGKIYWAEYDGHRIAHADLNGSNPMTLFNLSTTGGTPQVPRAGEPEGLALDLVARKVYWGDGTSGAIQCGNLDGTGFRYLGLTAHATGAIAVDPVAGYIYFDSEMPPFTGLYEIRRADLDGSVGSNTVLYSGLNELTGVLGMDVIPPYAYCSPATPNSTGRPAAMTVLGSVLTVANNIRLETTDLPSSSFAFYLVSQTQGFTANPGGSQGDICLNGAIGRFVGAGQVLNTGAAGSVSLTLNLGQIPQPTGPVGVTAGDTWNFQLWYRDAVGGSATSNFSDGLSVTFQ